MATATGIVLPRSKYFSCMSKLAMLPFEDV